MEAGPQFGGHVVNYQHNLSFVSVHGSGHMVPQFRPRAAFKLVSHLISGESFAVPWASDDALEKMKDSDFDDYLNTYTIDAKASV